MATPALTILAMTANDFAEADALRRLAGWNQTLSDWQRFLNCAPNGCFVAVHGEALAGTATTISYGKELGWIGMLLVHPEHRRHGIGSGLLQHCIECLVGQGVRSIKLDATPLGKPLYERHGFQTELGLTRWETAGIAPGALPPRSAILSSAEADLAEIATFDEKAFGVSRRVLLGELLKQALATVVHRSAVGRIEGFGMLRAGARAHYLGPVVAATNPSARQITLDLLAQVPGRAVYWDILDANTSAAALARALGFTAQRTLLRMFKLESFGRADPLLQWAIVDPAVG